MTPLGLQIILHYYISCDQFPNLSAPAVANTLRCFVQEELLTGYQGYYKITERGSAYVKMLCNIPLPAKAWVDDKGEVIK